MELDSSFEDDLKEALLEDIEQTLQEEYGPQLIETARENWQAYASRNGYDIDHIWEDVEGPIVERDGDSIVLRLEWPGLTALFEWGVAPHTIQGNPYLHFYWDRIDQWIKTEEVNWGSETGGIPASRAIRNAMADIRRVMS